MPTERATSATNGAGDPADWIVRLLERIDTIFKQTRSKTLHFVCEAGWSPVAGIAAGIDRKLSKKAQT